MLASTGIRALAWRDIKIKHIETKMTGEGMKDEGLLYKVKVYLGEPEECFTFTIPEARDAIKRYLEFRKRCSSLNLIFEQVCLNVSSFT